MPSPLIEDTPQTGFVVSPIGSSQRDVEAILSMNAESFRFLYPTIRFKQFDGSDTVKDPLYGEVVGAVIYREPIQIPALVIPDPPMKLLKKYGLEVEQEAIAIMNCRLNEKAKVFPVERDRMEYYGIWWEILTVKYQDYFTNTQIPLNQLLTLKQANER